MKSLSDEAGNLQQIQNNTDEPVIFDLLDGEKVIIKAGTIEPRKQYNYDNPAEALEEPAISSKSEDLIVVDKLGKDLIVRFEAETENEAE